MTNVDSSAFANQLLFFSNPNISTFDNQEFVDPTNVQYAPISHAMSAQAYTDPDFRQQNISGFKYDREHSTEDIAQYVHDGKTKNDKRIVIAYTGTKPSKGHHIRADGALTTGFFHKSKIAKDAINHLDKTKQDYPNHSIHLSGHSLGSFSSAYVAHARPKSVSSSIGYNVPGSIPGVASSMIRPFYETTAQKKVQNTRAEFTNNLDPVSLLNFRKNRNKKQHLIC